MSAESDIERDRRIAKRLHRAWPTFFEVFGRLTPVQREVIPAILDGEDVLVCSATASGKTEAACAPLVELNIDRKHPWTVLYISPTRALVNDLYERLYCPLNRLGMSIERRTGDHRVSLKASPHFLLTTPESFDSLLCRGRLKGDLGHILAPTVAVVLDEIHLLYGTARGEQARWLLDRLYRLRSFAKGKGWVDNSAVQVICLSATVADPAAVAKMYLKRGRVLKIPGSRRIETVFPTDELHTVEKDLPLYLSSLDRSEKVLVFSNSRQRVDKLAADMKSSLEGLGYCVVAHHGSLSKRLREDAERAVKAYSRIVVFATSTLEIGVDIGDIDLVIFDGPANDISSVLQRMGRGNRRTDKTRVMTCAKSTTEALIQTAMIHAAREGWLGDDSFGPQYAVARQQLASYIFQSSGRSRSRNRLQDFLGNFLGSAQAQEILDSMLDSGELIYDRSGLRLGEEWLESSASGNMHSNIEETYGAKVIDEQTGKHIASGVNFRRGKGLTVGGQLLNVKDMGQGKIFVRQVKDKDKASGEWGYMSTVAMRSDSQAVAVGRYLGIHEGIWPVVSSQGRANVYHFGGERVSYLVKLMAKAAKVEDEVFSTGAFRVSLAVKHSSLHKPKWILDADETKVESLVTREYETIERALGRPWANKRLPEAMRISEVKGWLGIREGIKRIASAKFVLEHEALGNIERYFEKV